jgi:hypothetical protein
VGEIVHQWRKDIVQWRCGDTLYLSVPFTWLMEEAESIAAKHKGKVIAGGPAVKLVGAPWAETPDECKFDVLSMHNPCATFTTRGCGNRCGYCAVPKIEGDFRELQTWKPAPIVCDNNLLMASKAHFERVIESLRPFPAVDFNQGLEARRFTRWHADLIATLHNPMIRFACDYANAKSSVADAVAIGRAAGLRNFGVYVLIGFNDTPDDALDRLNFVRSLDIRPNAQRYQPLDAKQKNAYVYRDGGWTEFELYRMAKYHNRLRWYEHIPYNEFLAEHEPLFAIGAAEWKG